MKQDEAFDLLNAQLKDIPKAQIRSMSLAVLPRLINALESHQDTCPNCSKLNKDGEAFIRNIRPLFEQNIPEIKKFEQWVETSQKHLKQDHQQHVKGRVASTYTTIGMATGTLSAFLYLQFVPEISTFGSISLGWTIGTVVGYVVGKIKEQILSKKDKLY